MVDIKRYLDVARMRLPGPVRQEGWIRLEHLHVARLVQQRMVKPGFTGKPKMRRSPIEPIEREVSVRSITMVNNSTDGMLTARWS